MKEAGLPDGVVNVIFGIGPRAGEALINHEDVNVCSKTKILLLSHLKCCFIFEKSGNFLYWKYCCRAPHRTGGGKVD